MKKLLTIAAIAASLLSSSAFALAPYDFYYTRVNSAADSLEFQFVPVPAGSANGLLILNGSNSWPAYATFGTGISYDSGTNTVNVAAAPTPTINNGVSRPINSTAFQPSATKTTHGIYSITIASALSLSGGQDGSAFLEISADGSTGWTEVGRVRNGNTGTLTIGLNTVQTQTYQLSGQIPAGYYGRIRTANNTGTPTFTYVTGQETLF